MARWHVHRWTCHFLRPLLLRLRYCTLIDQLHPVSFGVACIDCRDHRLLKAFKAVGSVILSLSGPVCCNTAVFRSCDHAVCRSSVAYCSRMSFMPCGLPLYRRHFLVSRLVLGCMHRSSFREWALLSVTNAAGPPKLMVDGRLWGSGRELFMLLA